MCELWKDVPGFKGLYQVSTFGRIKSFKKQKNNINGFLEPSLANNGYLRIGLRKDNKRTYFTMQKLVLSTFIGFRPKGMEAAHRNGNKLDNNLDNLRWTTRKDNMRDRVQENNKKRIERNFLNVS